MKKLTIEPGAFYTPRELMEALGIGRTAVYRWASNEALRPIRIGRCVKFRGEDVIAYLESLREAGTRRVV